METLSKVYFIALHKSDDKKIIKEKLARLLDKSRLLDCIEKEDNVAVKIHFGEEANTGFVRPEYVKVINDALAEKEATFFVSDTNTLYQGRRTNAQDHLELACEHGFTPDVVGAPVVIADDTEKEDTSEITINQKFIKVAKIARLFAQAKAIVDVSHFKGHMMTGFGGALKNLGMGCATRVGKMAQHSDMSPVIIEENCVGCKACQEVCPAEAISVENKKAHLDASRCIGCASCIAACKYEAIDVNWASGKDTIQEKMVEYASAVLKGKEKKCVFLNFLIKITKQCDCLAKDDPRIAPDIGILASCDPLSIDKASLDLVNKACGRDIFKEVHPGVDGSKQLKHAFRLGLGNLNYQLIEL